ncbi:hypothetical protein [Heyndrickxia acidicola]|uniref:Uncharacterized protein n=1 Tax=Heyndrickxia acidicola TaxID=209389 RepID=A0ABU6MHQ5_9BACI|nr:hypothetical protein [Heyndrickxia acidicola]MED1202590.1 hypothetical protein [Heyndrickxia acidicola]
MLIRHPDLDFKQTHAYYFRDTKGKECTMTSEEKLEVGSVVIADSFPGTYSMRITKLWREAERTFFEWESFKVTLGHVKLDLI